MKSEKEIKDERIALYFDLICGVVTSSVALTGLTYVFVSHRIFSIGWFTISITFWLGFLLLSLLLIGYGIYTYQKNKHFDSSEPRKDLKAPIV